MANPRRPRDPNQRAKLIVEIATGESDEPRAPRDTPASTHGRQGGQSGGLARAAKLTPKQLAAGVADHVWTLREIASLLD